MAMHNELWFPSVIWSSILHSVDNDQLKRFAYDLKSKDKKGLAVSNYNGWQSKPLLANQNDQVDKLVSAINEEIDFCSTQVGLPKLTIQNIWININPPHAYNELHDHVGSVLSGVYYIDADADQGLIQFNRPDGAEHFLPYKCEKQTYFTSTRATYRPLTNALLVFPSWLKHQVQGNNSNRDRISISFNYGIEEIKDAS